MDELSDTKIRNATAADKEYAIADGQGLSEPLARVVRCADGAHLALLDQARKGFQRLFKRRWKALRS